MKRILCLLLAMLLLAGCASDPAAPKTTEVPSDTAENGIIPVSEPPDEEQKPDHFGLCYVAEYGFNPYSCLCITNRPILSLVYEGLFVINGSFEPEPVLCQKFAVSEDGRRYLFTICPDAAFSDSSPVTAEDVVASLEAARGSDYYGSRFSRVYAFTAESEKTVSVTLRDPYENLPLLLDVPIVKKGTAEDPRPIGSGPYAFSRGTKPGLYRCRAWWQNRGAPVEFDTIRLTAEKNPTEIRDSFEFGDTSLVCVDLNAPTAVGYRCDYELWDCPTTAMVYLGFNFNAGMFVNEAFRAGITHLIDRSEILTICKGFAESACLPCAPASPLYDAELAKGYDYDPAAFARVKAKANLSPDYVGTLLVCSADPTLVEIAHRISDMFTRAGVRVEVSAVDYDTYHYRLSAGQFDCFLGETRLSANFDLSEFFRRYGSLSFGGIASGGMEGLCADALENSGNCYELYRNVMERGCICPLLFKSYAVMAGRGMIASLQPAVDSVFHLAGGRSLAEAGADYEVLSGAAAPEQTDETGETAETTETEP